MQMKDSRLPPDWVARAVADNPVQLWTDGQSFVSCPVRLAFTHIVKPNPNAKNDDGTPKADPAYEVTLLFPPGGQEQLNATVWPKVYEMLRQEFPQNFNSQGQPFGLHCPPWRDQGEKQQYAGYTPGLPFMRLTSRYKPQIVDAAQNAVVDEARVYAGVWAIVHFNVYTFGRNPPRPKKGVTGGLISVMLIADDEKLAGGAPDPKASFGGVKVQARFDAAAAFGAAAPPGSFMPPPSAVRGAPPPPPAAATDEDWM